jgi:hypothetical protein
MRKFLVAAESVPVTLTLPKNLPAYPVVLEALMPLLLVLLASTPMPLVLIAQIAVSDLALT